MEETWPELPLERWRDTYATLHLWAQIVGKTRLALAPPLNHWWQVAQYVTSRGLTTSPIPHNGRTFEVEFDFVDHTLVVTASDGSSGVIPLRPQTVAQFYHEYMNLLGSLGLPVTIWPMPVEIESTLRFSDDGIHRSYDRDWANRMWRVLVQADRVLHRFRGRFLGKASPVHFFWGSFDLAATRFSGRPAPLHPGGAPNLGTWVMQEAYSHECSSIGFWPGGAAIPEPVFYSYAYPEPEGFRTFPVSPAAARYDDTMREFVLSYEAVRTSATPDDTLLEFAETTYSAAADLAGWDRRNLERSASSGDRHHAKLDANQ
jgi:hypothetical protein